MRYQRTELICVESHLHKPVNQYYSSVVFIFLYTADFKLNLQDLAKVYHNFDSWDVINSVFEISDQFSRKVFLKAY